MVLKDNKRKKKKSQNLIDSFHYAGEGILFGIKNVRNLKIHLAFATLVILGGIFFQISSTEWLLSVLWIAIVISLELVNTAVEETVDLAMPNIHPVAKIAKDVAAGAVLVAAIAAFISGVLIFLPKIISLF